LLWRHLTFDQCVELTTTSDCRALVREYLNLTGQTRRPGFQPLYQTQREQALEDLFFDVVRFCKGAAFSLEEMSCAVGIMWKVHREAMEAQWPWQKAFQGVSDLVVAHSVQRPPYSVAILSARNAKAFVSYVADTYFKHYKLYVYVFADRMVVDFTQQSAPKPVETVPTSTSSAGAGGVGDGDWLSPLAEAMDEGAWATHEEAKRVEEEARLAEERARMEEERKAAEIAEKEKLEAELDPREEVVKEVVTRQVTAQVNEMTEKLRLEHEAREAELLAKIAALEAK